MDFAPESPVVIQPPWKIVLVDDEPEVHEVTRLVLAGFRFEDLGTWIFPKPIGRWMMLRRCT